MKDHRITNSNDPRPTINTIYPLRTDQSSLYCLDEASSAEALLSGHAMLDTAFGPIYADLEDIRLGDAGQLEISFTVGCDHSSIAHVSLVLADLPAMTMISHFDAVHLYQWIAGPDPCRSELAILARRRLLEHIVLSWVTELGQEMNSILCSGR